MAGATFAQTSFLGGLWGRYAQGRFDRPDYRTALNECLNSYPIETGAWTRRPGTRFAQTTRGGQPGRVLTFDFKQAAPYTIEFTAGMLRFRSGVNLVTTNDDQVVISVSNASPAKVKTGAHGWSTGNAVKFPNLGASCPGLQNKVFVITVTSSTEFTLADGITGQDVNGATLGAIAAGATVQRVLEVASPYTDSLWLDVRMVQAEKQAVLLHPSIAPYVLTAVPPGVGQTFYGFTLALANLLDGPYLDPFTNGVQITPSATSGNITLTLSFAAYSASKSYSVGDFVLDAGVNYQSLADQNEGNTPASSPTKWKTASAGLGVGPNGFVGADVGRLIRMQNDSGSWVWGKITGSANIIDRALAGSVNFGSMSSNGGLAAAFDGVTSQSAAASATALFSGTDPCTAYIGKNYSGASAQTIEHVSVWWSTSGFGTATKTYTTTVTNYQADLARSYSITSGPTPTTVTVAMSFTFQQVNLRAKHTAPVSLADGTLLGFAAYDGRSVLNIISNDKTTAWEYVWIEIVASGFDFTIPGAIDTRVASPSPGSTATTEFSVLNAWNVGLYVAELQLFSPTGTGSGAAVTFQLLGANVLGGTTARTNWRLGLYSNTTGWPSCGTYHEGRLWLAGVGDNRLDSSVSNDRFNFAPTDATTSHTVLDSSAISAVFNASDVNPIFWLVPDALGIICGTQAGPWLVQATANNIPLTPTTIQAHRYSKLGCANIEPRLAGETLVWVQRYRRKVFEYFADVFSGKFAAANITWALKSLTKPRIAELAYQHELSPIVWARCDGGSWFGITYKRESKVTSQPPNFAAGHRHVLGSGRTVESITAGPSSDGNTDALTMVTNDPATNIRHVEIMATQFEEGDDLTSAWFLDDAVLPTSYVAGISVFTINGLWHIDNEIVTVFAGGLDCGEWKVSNGTIVMTYGDGISAGTGGGLFTRDFVNSFGTAMPLAVGFTFTSDGQIVRAVSAQESGARNGPALGKRRRNHQVAVLLVDTVGGMQSDNRTAAGISFGTSFAGPLDPAIKDFEGAAIAANHLFNGIYRATIDDRSSFDGMPCWRITRPYPATVAAVEPFIETQDA